MSFDDVSLTAIVPVRKGSQRIPGKNLRPFHQSPEGEVVSLLEWKLRQLLAVLPGEKILVSTDWDLSADAARKLGCLVHDRDPELTGPDSPFNDVISGVVSQVATEHAMWCPATSPLIGPRRIKEFLEIYGGLPVERKSEGLIAVSRTSSYCFMGGAPMNFSLGAGHVRTQEIEPIEVMNWALSVRPKEAIIAAAYMFSEAATRLVVDDWENTDINDAIDFQTAQLLLPMYFAHESGSSEVTK